PRTAEEPLKGRETRVENHTSSPLAVIKIVEYGQGVSAAFGAKLLADLGADVIKVEPAEGDLTRRCGPFPNAGASNLVSAKVATRPADPEKSGLFIYLNTNKRGVVIDLRQTEGQQLFDRLLRRADVLIHNVPPPERAALGLESAILRQRYPALIIAGVSVFG